MIRLLASSLIAALLIAESRAATPIDLGPGKQPQVAVSSTGEIFVAFGRENSIVFAHSTASEKSFSPPAVVAHPKFTPLGMRRGPRIVATRDAIVIAAVIGEKGGGKDGDVFVFRSTDDGATWTQSARINGVASSAREGLLGIATDGDSRILATWLDDRSEHKEIYAALSTDSGHTFAADTLVYRSPDGHVCECCHPSAVFDGNGNCYVMFRNRLGGNRDMYVARSRDNGRSFDPATKLGEGSWKLNGCPMDGGAIAGRGDEVLTVWQRNGDIFRASLRGPESLIGHGTQPTTDGNLIAWTDAKHNLIFMSAFGSNEAKVADNALDPALAGNGTVSACAWESNGHCFISCDDSRDLLNSATTQPSP